MNAATVRYALAVLQGSTRAQKREGCDTYAQTTTHTKCALINASTAEWWLIGARSVTALVEIFRLCDITHAIVCLNMPACAVYQANTSLGRVRWVERSHKTTQILHCSTCQKVQKWFQHLYFIISFPASSAVASSWHDIHSFCYKWHTF